MVVVKVLYRVLSSVYFVLHLLSTSYINIFVEDYNLKQGLVLKLTQLLFVIRGTSKIIEYNLFEPYLGLVTKSFEVFFLTCPLTSFVQDYILQPGPELKQVQLSILLCCSSKTCWYNWSIFRAGHKKVSSPLLELSMHKERLSCFGMPASK